MLNSGGFASRRRALGATWRRWRRLQRLWPVVAVAAAAGLLTLAAVDSIWQLVFTVIALSVFSVAVLCGVELDRFTSRHAINTAAAQLRRLEQLVITREQGSPLDPALREMAERLQVAMAADSAAVLTMDGNELVLRAVTGTIDPRSIGLRRPAGDDLIGMVVRDGHTQAVPGSAPAAVAIPDFMAGSVSAAASPLWLDGVTIGAVAVGHARQAEHDVADVALLEIAASRMVTAIESARLGERERRATLGQARAREHIRMLGDSSRVLLRSLDDYEGPLAEVINTVIGEFASLAAVFLADSPSSGDLRVVAARLRDADIPVQFTPTSLEPIRAAMASGRSRLTVLSDVSRATGETSELDGALLAMGVTSYVVAPIQVRGLAFGALLFGTARGVRGFRPSDHAAIDDLAQRVALAIESSLLYREARSNAAAMARHMHRLRSLLDTKLAIASDSSRVDILSTSARGVGQLYPSCRVVLALGDEQYDETGQRLTAGFSPEAVDLLGKGDGLMRDADIPRRELPESDRALLPSACVVVPIAPIHSQRGFVLIETAAADFTEEDESLIGLLVRMMSTSLFNDALNEQTRAAATRMQAIFRASPAAIVTLGADVSVHDYNPAARELFGWDVADSAPVLPPTVRARVSDLATRISLDDEPQQADLVLVGDDGERSLVLMLAPAWTDADTDRGYVLVVTDETERVQLAMQFEQAQRLEAIGRLAGGVAHDFNNLLTVIHGYTDGLLRRMDASDPNRDRIAAIARAGSRGAELTKQLLTISRQQVVTPIVLRPAAVIEELRGMLGKMVGESITIVHAPGDDDLRVSIDKLQLEQILFNLAANARDAMPHGGMLKLSVHRASPPRTAMSASDTDGGAEWVELRVSDNGAGMDSATLARCLDPLYTTKELGQGSGLGLSTVYGIATQNGGDVTISSTPGRGTTVSILLPAVEDEVTVVSEITLPGPLDAAATGTGTVLLVEDDQEVRWMVLRMLRERGYHTLTADNGLDALDLMREHGDKIDLLLTDVAMPGMSGPEVARSIRAIRPIPVLFMSGYAEKLSRAADRGDYPAEFLAKPFTPDALVTAVQRTMRLADRSQQLT
jgi:signal transduction histidine kinase/ActR/RegA family two-component response regulator